MNLIPRNRHLVVEPILREEQEEGSKVLLPDDYLKSKREEPHISVRVLQVAPDCDINVCKGDIAVIESRMLQEIDIQNVKVNIILQNYVLGVLSSRSLA